MKITTMHLVVVVVVIISATIIGAKHMLTSQDLTTVYIGCLSSLTGHAVGYAAHSQDTR